MSAITCPSKAHNRLSFVFFGLKSITTPSAIYKNSHCSTQTKRLAQHKAEALTRSKSEIPWTSRTTRSLPALCNTTGMLNFRGVKLTEPGKSWTELRVGTGRSVCWCNIYFPGQSQDRASLEPPDSQDPKVSQDRAKS